MGELGEVVGGLFGALDEGGEEVVAAGHMEAEEGKEDDGEEDEESEAESADEGIGERSCQAGEGSSPVGGLGWTWWRNGNGFGCWCWC